MSRQRWLQTNLAAMCLMATTATAFAQSAKGAPAVGSTERQQALDWFKKGNDAYLAGDTQAAYEAYRKSYALNPGFDVACNLGRSEAELGKNPEAAEHLAICLENFTMSTRPEIRAAEKRFRDLMVELRAKVSGLQITVAPAGADVSVNGTSIGKAPIEREIFLEPGDHRIAATLDGYEPTEQTLTLAQGSTREVRLTLARTNSGSSSVDAGLDVDAFGDTSPTANEKPTWPYWVSGGVALVGVGVGVGFLLDANAKGDRIADLQADLTATGGNSLCAGGAFSSTCTELSNALSDYDRSRNIAVGGFIGAGVGVVAFLSYHLFVPEGPIGARVQVGRQHAGVVVNSNF